MTHEIVALNAPIPEAFQKPLALRCNVCGKVFEQTREFGRLFIFITCPECRKEKHEDPHA